MSQRPAPIHPLDFIVDLARTHARDHEILTKRIRALEDERDALKTKHEFSINEAAKRARESGSRLAAAIEAAPELFQKPRTQEVQGIKFGLQKGKGQTLIPNPEATIKKVRELLPEQAETVIQTKESIVRKALGNLSAKELKAIGVTITQTGDSVVIKSTDDKINKLVEKVLSDLTPASES